MIGSFTERQQIGLMELATRYPDLVEVFRQSSEAMQFLQEKIETLKAENDRLAMALASRPRAADPNSQHEYAMAFAIWVVLGAGWPLVAMFYVPRFGVDLGAIMPLLMSVVWSAVAAVYLKRIWRGKR